MKKPVFLRIFIEHKLTLNAMKEHINKYAGILLLIGVMAIVAGFTSPAKKFSFADERSKAPEKIDPDCTFKGKKMYGKVKIVESFPDYKVKVVTSFPDLKVKNVTSFPSECGKWQFVESFPDFTVKFVESFPDFTIKYVESFPGLP